MENTTHLKKYECLSTEPKPKPKLTPAEVVEIDTGKVFRWYKGKWYEVGGGGA